MKKENKRRLLYLVWAAIVVVQILVIYYWANQKVGVYVDEMFTFESVHNLVIRPYGDPLYRLSGDENLRNQWHDLEYFQQHFTVNEGESFFDISFRDQLYVLTHLKWHKILLNIIMSFQRGSYNLWVSFWPNVIMFIVLQFLLWRFSKKVLGDDKLIGLLPVILFGFSAGAVTFVIYIRQYTEYMMNTVILTMLGTRLLDNKLSWKKQAGLYAGLLITLWISMRDMEFTLVFFAIQFGLIFLVLLKHRDRKCILYAGAVVLGLILMRDRIWGYIANGGMVEPLFFRSWSDTWITAKKIWDMYYELVFGDMITIVSVLVLFVIGVCYCIKRKQTLEFYSKKQIEILFILFGTVILYSVLIIRLISRQYQYMSCCFPILFLGLVLLALPIIKKVPVQALAAASLLVAGVVLYSNAHFNNIKYLTREPKELVQELAKEEYRVPYIYINKITETQEEYEGLFTLYRDIWLWRADVPCLVTTEEYLKSGGELQADQYGDAVLLWINLEDDQQEIFNQFMAVTGFNSAVEIGRSEKSDVYYCIKV